MNLTITNFNDILDTFIDAWDLDRGRSWVILFFLFFKKVFCFSLFSGIVRGYAGLMCNARTLMGFHEWNSVTPHSQKAYNTFKTVMLFGVVWNGILTVQMTTNSVKLLEETGHVRQMFWLTLPLDKSRRGLCQLFQISFCIEAFWFSFLEDLEHTELCSCKERKVVYSMCSVTNEMQYRSCFVWFLVILIRSPMPSHLTVLLLITLIVSITVSILKFRVNFINFLILKVRI